jgi:hypothetical protein
LLGLPVKKAKFKIYINQQLTGAIGFVALPKNKDEGKP